MINGSPINISDHSFLVCLGENDHIYTLHKPIVHNNPSMGQSCQCATLENTQDHLTRTSPKILGEIRKILGQARMG